MSNSQAVESPIVLDVMPDSIPTDLTAINQWIGWIVGKSKAGGKYDKIPVDTQTKACNAHTSENWMSFEEAVLRYENGFFDGVGFVLTGEPVLTKSGDQLYLIGIDIDHCVYCDEDGEDVFDDEVFEIWDELGCPYMEFSPSGTGARLFVYSKERIESSSANGNEMYISGRYLTLTGHGNGKIVEATEAVLALHRMWFPKKHIKSASIIANTSPSKYIKSASEEEASILSALEVLPAGTNYNDWRDIVWSIKSSGLENAEDIARTWSLSAPERYTNEGFDAVWESFDPARGITLGTLYHHAKLEGWISPTSSLIQDIDEGDILNGRLYADANINKQLFIHETGDLLNYSSAGWVHAPPGEAEQSAKAIVKSLRAEVAELYKLDPTGSETKRKMAHATKSSMEPRIKAMISMAQSEPGMTVRLSAFDSDPVLLGVSNGVLDLSASRLLDPSPSILISMRANVAFIDGARCPRWVRFLNTVQPDKSVQRLLQQLVGIFLSGEPGQQKLIILYGLGANGKSTFIEVISWLLGDYGLRIATEMLMHHQRSPQAASPDIVSLKGRRMAYCNEVEEGRRLDEARVKEHTGGDTLTGRAPYAKHSITFRPTHNLVIVGNHKPEIRDMSHGMWRRILLIIFGVTIPSEMQDPSLVEKLKAEAPGILNWALAGYRDYKKVGLISPKTVAAAATEYKDEEDILAEWLGDHAEAAGWGKSPLCDTYKAYQYWSKEHGHHPLAQSRLTKRLKDRGFDRDPGKRHYVGFNLKEEGKRAASQFY
jgi:putative DNA primase/helicase